MKEKLENLCNDFSNASQILSVMGKGAWECANIVNCTDDESKPTELFQEISYALVFVSDALREKAEALWTLIDDLEV